MDFSEYCETCEYFEFCLEAEYNQNEVICTKELKENDR